MKSHICKPNIIIFINCDAMWKIESVMYIEYIIVYDIHRVYYSI